MSRSLEERLDDIRKAADRCLDYRDALDLSDLGSMALDAVLWNLAVIGEAVRNLPIEFRKAHPEVPWPAIAGLRNVLIHEYFRVDVELIRDIAGEQLDQLRLAINGR